MSAKTKKLLEVQKHIHEDEHGNRSELSRAVYDDGSSEDLKPETSQPTAKKSANTKAAKSK